MSSPGTSLRPSWSQPWVHALVLALVIRGILALLLGPPALVDDDQRTYLGLRDVLLARGVFADPVTLRPTAFRDPGYPVFLSAIAGLVGPGLTPIFVGQALLGAITAALLVATATVLAGASAGSIAVLLTGLALPLAALSSTVYSENLAAPLLALVGFLLVLDPGRSEGRRACFAGAVASVLAIVRWAVAPIALGMLAFGLPGPRRNVLAAIAIFLALPVAWSLRNEATVGVLTPNTNGIYNAYLGSHALTPTTHPYRAMYDSLVHAGLPRSDEKTRTTLASRATLASWRTRPGRNLRLAGAKVVDALGPDRMLAGLIARGQYPGLSTNAGFIIGLLVALGGFLLSIAGLASVLAGRDRWTRVGAALLGMSLLTQAATLGHPRFTTLLWMVLLPGAAVTILRATEAGVRERRALVAATIVLTGIGALHLVDIIGTMASGR